MGSDTRCFVCGRPDGSWIDRVMAFLCPACRADSDRIALERGDLTAFVDPVTREHHA